MFVKQYRPQPVWAVKHEQLGTVHFNRNGDAVDFRPATVDGPFMTFQTARERAKETPHLYLMYRPAKGIEKDALAVSYTVTSVEYGRYKMTIVGQHPTMMYLNVAMYPVPQEVTYTTEHYGQAIYGFPFPELVQEAVAEDRKRSEERVNALLVKATSAVPTNEEIVAAVAKLTGLERRWVRRWATLGKARAQAEATLRQLWPNTNTERIMERVRVVCVVNVVKGEEEES